MAYNSTWRTCRKCGLCRFRKNVVLGRGDVPCDVLLVGEAPGRSEDLMGTPFYGKAGRILNKAIQTACDLAQSEGLMDEPPRIFIDNVCGCRPTDSKHGDNRPPSSDEAKACLPRLVETIKRVRPSVVVFMGKTAQKFSKFITGEQYNGQRAYVMHPMACGYAGGVSGPMFLPLVRGLVNAFILTQKGSGE